MELLYEHTLRQQTIIEAQGVRLEDQQARILRLETMTAAGGAMVVASGAVDAAKAETGAVAAPKVAAGGAGADAAGSASAAAVAVTAEGDARVDINNQAITINLYGQEDVSHITRARLGAILDECAGLAPERAAETVLRLVVELIYGGREKPENMTCFMPGGGVPRRALVHARQSGANQWKAREAGDVMVEMASQGLDLIHENRPPPGDGPRAALARRVIAREHDLVAAEIPLPVLEENKARLAGGAGAGAAAV